MGKGIFYIFASACTLVAGLQAGAQVADKIDRKALVSRHNITLNQVRPESPSQVGNGEFAYGFDITGMQTFIKFNTMAHWAWHSEPMPEGMESEADFKGLEIKADGRKIRLPVSENSVRGMSKSFRRDNPENVTSDEQKKMAAYLASNPHAAPLGRIGLDLRKADGSRPRLSDFKRYDCTQYINLWTGVADSQFKLDGKDVNVKTLCRQDSDVLAFRISSDILRDGRIKIAFEFPYPSTCERKTTLGDYSKPGAHSSKAEAEKNRATISRRADDLIYSLEISWNGPAEFSPDESNPHKFYLAPKSDSIELVCRFAKGGARKAEPMPTFEESLEECKAAWKKYWESGAAIDFSGSIDPRARELERRAVLSQYLMKVNEAGSLPPQESGLVNNSWAGRFHYEMIWWHVVHFSQWGRPELAEKQLSIFRKYLPDAIERAKAQGNSGARWPKCTGDTFREWPHIIHYTLIWQQPHPIYFAQQQYRINPSKATLEKWKDVVFQTAEFLADLPVHNDATGFYDLRPPLTVVSENTDPLTTKNPTFELSYFRYGLRTALEWKRMLGEPAPEKWERVLKNLAPLPVENGLYVLHEGVEDMWTRYAYEHPALIGVYGMLPGDGADRKTAKDTLAKVSQTWRFDGMWGWDFPMLAMAAARTGNRELAVSYLSHLSEKFRFDEHALVNWNGLIYFPANGGFLSALAMLAGGWDNAADEDFDPVFLGFPKDGNWKVRAEGFNRYE